MGSDNSALKFLQKDYELKINYLTDHFSRMWTRFNFFIALESALSVALFGLFDANVGFSENATLIAVIGTVSSVFWYAFGAQDRYLVEIYRTHVEEAGAKIAEKLGLEIYLGSEYVHVGDTSTKIKQYVYQWRLEPFSPTKLAAWFPLGVLLYWIAIIVLTLKIGSL
jgi:hypothetical protein